MRVVAQHFVDCQPPTIIASNSLEFYCSTCSLCFIHFHSLFSNSLPFNFTCLLSTLTTLSLLCKTLKPVNFKWFTFFPFLLFPLSRYFILTFFAFFIFFFFFFFISLN